MVDNLLETYNPLYDVHLRQYFALPHMQKHLRDVGLLEENTMIAAADSHTVYSHHQQMMDMLLRNRERVLIQMADLHKKLDAAEKVEICRRIRSGLPIHIDEEDAAFVSRRVGHASRSLSRPTRGRITGDIRQRRRSISVDDSNELIQRIEADYRSDTETVKNPQNIYNRLAASVYKYQYLHKMDDRTLANYKESLSKQLQKLERFRELSFGPHSVAKHQPLANQQTASWFFRRRSLRKSRSGKSQSPRASASEAPPKNRYGESRWRAYYRQPRQTTESEQKQPSQQPVSLLPLRRPAGAQKVMTIQRNTQFSVKTATKAEKLPPPTAKVKPTVQLQKPIAKFSNEKLLIGKQNEYNPENILPEIEQLKETNVIAAKKQFSPGSSIATSSAPDADGEDTESRQSVDSTLVNTNNDLDFAGTPTYSSAAERAYSSHSPISAYADSLNGDGGRATKTLPTTEPDNIKMDDNGQQQYEFSRSESPASLKTPNYVTDVIKSTGIIEMPIVENIREIPQTDYETHLKEHEESNHIEKITDEMKNMSKREIENHEENDKHLIDTSESIFIQSLSKPEIKVEQALLSSANHNIVGNKNWNTEINGPNQSIDLLTSPINIRKNLIENQTEISETNDTVTALETSLTEAIQASENHVNIDNYNTIEHQMDENKTEENSSSEEPKHLEQLYGETEESNLYEHKRTGNIEDHNQTIEKRVENVHYENSSANIPQLNEAQTDKNDDNSQLNEFSTEVQSNSSKFENQTNDFEPISGQATIDDSLEDTTEIHKEIDELSMNQKNIEPENLSEIQDQQITGSFSTSYHHNEIAGKVDANDNLLSNVYDNYKGENDLIINQQRFEQFDANHQKQESDVMEIEFEIDEENAKKNGVLLQENEYFENKLHHELDNLETTENSEVDNDEMLIKKNVHKFPSTPQNSLSHLDEFDSTSAIKNDSKESLVDASIDNINAKNDKHIDDSEEINNQADYAYDNHVTQSVECRKDEELYSCNIDGTCHKISYDDNNKASENGDKIDCDDRQCADEASLVENDGNIDKKNIDELQKQMQQDIVPLDVIMPTSTYDADNLPNKNNHDDDNENGSEYRDSFNAEETFLNNTKMVRESDEITTFDNETRHYDQSNHLSHDQIQFNETDQARGSNFNTYEDKDCDADESKGDIHEKSHHDDDTTRNVEGGGDFFLQSLHSEDANNTNSYNSDSEWQRQDENREEFHDFNERSEQSFIAEKEKQEDYSHKPQNYSCYNDYENDNINEVERDANAYSTAKINYSESDSEGTNANESQYHADAIEQNIPHTFVDQTRSFYDGENNTNFEKLNEGYYHDTIENNVAPQHEQQENLFAKQPSIEVTLASEYSGSMEHISQLSKSKTPDVSTPQTPTSDCCSDAFELRDEYRKCEEIVGPNDDIQQMSYSNGQKIYDTKTSKTDQFDDKCDENEYNEGSEFISKDSANKNIYDDNDYKYSETSKLLDDQTYQPSNNECYKSESHQNIKYDQQESEDNNIYRNNYGTRNEKINGNSYDDDIDDEQDSGSVIIHDGHEKSDKDPFYQFHQERERDIS